MVQYSVRDDRRDRLKQLRAFCHSARLGSITKAAERIFSSQPSVSLQIRSLEEELGVTLFYRNGPRIGLTAAGRALYKRALPLVENLDRLPDTFIEQFRQSAGTLRIGAGETAASFLLPRYLLAFNARHAGAEVATLVGSGTACLSWLRSYEVDIIFAAMDVEPPDVEFRALLTSRYVLISPEDHPLATLGRAGPEDLGSYPQVAHTQQSFIRTYGEIYLRQRGVAPDVVVDIDGWESIKACVEAGLGIALVPDLCVTERDRVCRIPFDGPLPIRKYGYAIRKESTAPLAAQRFIEILDAPQPSGDASSREPAQRNARAHSGVRRAAAESPD